MIRPAATAFLRRWAEVIGAAVTFAFGLSVALRGGFVFLPLGAGIAALAAGFGLGASRRARFGQSHASAGFVEVVEGQIAYFAEGGSGGFIALPDMVDLRLLTLSGKRMWRLKQRDGQALLIPVDTVQNAQLFDAFAALPRMDSAALIAALAAPPAATDATKTLWRRAGS